MSQSGFFDPKSKQKESDQDSSQNAGFEQSLADFLKQQVPQLDEFHQQLLSQGKSEEEAKEGVKLATRKLADAYTNEYRSELDKMLKTKACVKK